MSQLDAKPGDIKRCGATEFWTAHDGTSFKRRIGTQQWKQVSAPPPSTPSSVLQTSTLYLVRTNQYEGEPLHWALVVSPAEEIHDASLKTMIFEVRGDPGDPGTGMHHSFNLNSRVTPRGMENVRDVFELGNLDKEQVDIVTDIATNEIPPRAENRRQVDENCQGWCVRVVRRLAERGWVKSEWLNKMAPMMEGFDYIR